MSNNDTINEQSFKLVGMAIQNCFTTLPKWRADWSFEHCNITRTEAYNRRLKFLRGRICQSFCDCSDNFEQNKLIKKYLETIKL